MLNYRNPGVASDDSWMGHYKVDPQHGKGTALTPAERMGRMTLNHIMEQTILQDPDRDRLMAKGQDKLGDSWIGHPLIDPMRGKPKTEQPQPDGVINSGCNVAEHAELPWVRHRKTPLEGARASEAAVKDIINGVNPPGWTPREEWGNRTKRERQEWNHSGRETVGQAMLPSIAQTNSGRPWQWDDGKVRCNYHLRHCVFQNIHRPLYLFSDLLFPACLLVGGSENSESSQAWRWAPGVREADAVLEAGREDQPVRSLRQQGAGPQQLHQWHNPGWLPWHNGVEEEPHQLVVWYCRLATRRSAGDNYGLLLLSQRNYEECLSFLYDCPII